MKQISKMLILVMLLALLLSAVSCNKTDDPADNSGENTDTTPPDESGDVNGDTDEGAGEGEGDNTDNKPTIDWESTGLEGLALIYNSVARFQVVYTSESGAKALELANDLVEKLRGFGVEIADPVADKGEAVAVAEVTTVTFLTERSVIAVTL